MTRNYWIALVVLTAGVLAWYMYHKSCPVCQEKWKLWKNRLGSHLMEAKPEGGPDA